MIKRQASLWLPVLACMLLIWGGSAKQGLDGPIMQADKWLHAGAYAVLQFISLRACHGGLQPFRLRAASVAATLSLVHGLVSEGLQSMVPGRVASGWDFAADTVGVAGASLIWWWVFRSRNGGASR